VLRIKKSGRAIWQDSVDSKTNILQVLKMFFLMNLIIFLKTVTVSLSNRYSNISNFQSHGYLSGNFILFA